MILSQVRLQAGSPATAAATPTEVIQSRGQPVHSVASPLVPSAQPQSHAPPRRSRQALTFCGFRTLMTCVMVPVLKAGRTLLLGDRSCSWNVCSEARGGSDTLTWPRCRGAPRPSSSSAGEKRLARHGTLAPDPSPAHGSCTSRPEERRGGRLGGWPCATAATCFFCCRRKLECGCCCAEQGATAPSRPDVTAVTAAPLLLLQKWGTAFAFLAQGGRRARNAPATLSQG